MNSRKKWRWALLALVLVPMLATEANRIIALQIVLGLGVGGLLFILCFAFITGRLDKPSVRWQDDADLVPYKVDGQPQGTEPELAVDQAS